MKQEKIFTRQALAAMIVPLLMEQLLAVLVGVADTLVISYAGEAAVSGVTLVNQFNTVFIFLFTALASGGAVVISQYIGNHNEEHATEASGQLLMFSILFSVMLSVIILLTNRSLLGFLFGRVEADVMESCIIYLRISAYSFPMLAVYNAGASLYRSMGKTSTTMYISIVANIVNIIGNILGVFVLHAGVAGVAWPSTIARTLSAVWITILCFQKNKMIRYRMQDILKFNGEMLKKILGIAIPNGVENGVFQLVKVALSSVVAMFGTYQIAANGIAQSMWSLTAISGVALGPVFITVIGQCMGNRDIDAAEYYFHLLLKITLAVSIVWNVITLVLAPFVIRMYDVEPRTRRLIMMLIVLHNIFNAVAFPFAGVLGNGLRAAGDVKFTMYVSIFTTAGVRFALSFLFALVFNMGVMGIAWAMCVDWTVKGIMQYVRMRNGKWKEFSVI